jgi:hypothetical protein
MIVILSAKCSQSKTNNSDYKSTIQKA